MRYAGVIAVVALAACGRSDAPPRQGQPEAAPPAPAPAPTAPAAPAAPTAPTAPSAPSAPSVAAKPDPLSKAPFRATSAQGAATIVETYFALIEEHDFAAARRLWSDPAQAGGESDPAGTGDPRRYAELHAEVGAPGSIEGAAGSLYVEVPVRLYGRLKSGAALTRREVAVLRRVNDVPGSTAEQRRWHIYRIGGEAGGGD